LGDLIFYVLPRRRRLVLSNLHHAFPEQSPAWRRRIGRESCRRLVETAMLSLAMPFIPERRLRIMVRSSSSLEAALAVHRAAHNDQGAGAPPPLLFATPHLCCWELLTAIPFAASAPFVEFGIIFRPLDNPGLDAWVKRTRERFGMRLLSRKQGFQEAIKVLRRHGCVGLLFDQNAGLQGALSLLFGRVCSTSELAGVLAEKFDARVFATFTRRLGFWRVELCAAPITHDGSAAGITLALNRWLESHLASNDNACASWLWAHDRWRNQDIPARRLRLEAKRDLLPVDLQTRGLPALPHKTRVWIRLPNWLGDVVMTLPLLRAIRVSRPDAEITLLAKTQFLPVLEQFGVADRIIPLPAPGPGRFLRFWRLRSEFPDCLLVFPTSLRGDLEAWLTRCRQRFGLLRKHRRRPFLTHVWRLPADFDETQTHQVKLWELFLRDFGLDAAPDFSPLRATSRSEKPAPAVIGLICGSENNPEKRWPVAHWQDLVGRMAAAHPAAHFRLFGTANDRSVTSEIARGLGPMVADLAGHTGLGEFAASLAQCDLLIANDTGGMHLANALGVPVLVLFGPTNPWRTGPVFHAPMRLLQPPGCSPTGGGKLQDLSPDAVLAAVNEMLA
jgi:ADP-heptose:LPS heptosyltransferase/lauroyl/myristoyl acyltransferase